MNGGWITAENLEVVQQKDMSTECGQQGEDVKVDVACFTRDFSMQNVLMQIGLPILSQEGMLIKGVKQWAMRCYACMKCDRDTARIFCQHCGNNTLVRVRMFVDSRGNVHYNKLWRAPNLKNTNVAVPRNKGGKKSTVYVTAEDQLPERARRKKFDEDIFDPDFQFGSGARGSHSQKKIVIVGQNKRYNQPRRRVNKKKKSPL